MGNAQPDINALLTPISGTNPAGEDLRYTDIYEQIKEARRADDMLNQGAWQREVKKSDWDLVIKIATKALQEKTKDLQIAAWLTESLIKKKGFAGLAGGLTIIVAFLRDYWENLYPLVVDGDLEYRIGPLEFLNDKVTPVIRDISITDEKVTPGYSWYKWQESRQKPAEGKITAEVFDSAASQSSKEYYEALADDIDACAEAFSKLDAVVDDKFGKESPRISEIKQAITDCQHVVGGILKDKGGRTHAHEPSREESKEDQIPKPALEDKMEMEPVESAKSLAGGMSLPSAQIVEQGDFEVAVWDDVQQTFKNSGIKTALLKLLNASISASSIRQKNRYRLMMAKLSIQAQRPDLARPIVEELYALIQELHLDQWETPVWIAEVLEAYYQCLKSAGAPDSDKSKADNELFPKLCSKDITKAFLYKKGG